MINITLNQVRLLKSLSLGERFPLSNLKGKIFQQLLDEHVLSKFPQGNGFIIYAHSPIALLNHLSNKYIKCSLDDYIEKMEINELRKVDNILMRGNSKSNETHPMNGFLVKSIEPIEVSLSKRKLVLSPEVWPVCFVSNHEEFTIPSDVTIVMVENPVKGPKKFFVPKFIDKLMHRFGDAELYDKQLSYRNSIISDEPGIQELMKIIDKEHKGLEQEIFNSKEYKKYTD